MRHPIKFLRYKLGLYDLKTEGSKWVEKHLGPEWVDEFCQKHDDVCRGIPIGGYAETAIFLDMVKRIQNEWWKE